MFHDAPCGPKEMETVGNLYLTFTETVGSDEWTKQDSKLWIFLIPGIVS